MYHYIPWMAALISTLGRFGVKPDSDEEEEAEQAEQAETKAELADVGAELDSNFNSSDSD